MSSSSLVNLFSRAVLNNQPVALLHQCLPLLLAGVLLSLIGLVEDLLRGGPPLETITSHFLGGGLAANLVATAGLTHALTGRVELWEKKHRILIAFVCHIAARTLHSLVELCGNKKKHTCTCYDGPDGFTQCLSRHSGHTRRQSNSMTTD